MATGNITEDDVSFSIYGFNVSKIKKATNRQLDSLEKLLSEKVHGVMWANVEDVGHLCVSWIGTHGCYKDGERAAVIDAINKVFKTNNKQ